MSIALARLVTAALKRGTIPWLLPWETCRNGPPHNPLTGNPYTGLNVLLLNITMLERSYNDPRWSSFNQIMDHGLSFRPHQRKDVGLGGTRVMRISEKGIRGRLITWIVFSFQQLEGAPAAEAIHQTRRSGYSRASELLEVLELTYDDGHNSAAYGDYIRGSEQIPSALHEALHQTRYAHLLPHPGSVDPVQEELIVEMATGLLCYQLGIEGRLEHPEMMNSWIQLLEKGPTRVFRTCTAARETVEYVLEQE